MSIATKTHIKVSGISHQGSVGREKKHWSCRFTIYFNTVISDIFPPLEKVCLEKLLQSVMVAAAGYQTLVSHLFLLDPHSTRATSRFHYLGSEGEGLTFWCLSMGEQVYGPLHEYGSSNPHSLPLVRPCGTFCINYCLYANWPTSQPCHH